MCGAFPGGIANGGCRCVRSLPMRNFQRSLTMCAGPALENCHRRLLMCAGPALEKSDAADVCRASPGGIRIRKPGWIKWYIQCVQVYRTSRHIRKLSSLECVRNIAPAITHVKLRPRICVVFFSKCRDHSPLRGIIRTKSPANCVCYASEIASGVS